MCIEIRLGTHRSTKSDQKRCHVAPAHEGDTEGLDAVIDVHAVLERGHGEAVGCAGVFAYLPPGVHADFVLLVGLLVVGDIFGEVEGKGLSGEEGKGTYQAMKLMENFQDTDVTISHFFGNLLQVIGWRAVEAC